MKFARYYSLATAFTAAIALTAWGCGPAEPITGPQDSRPQASIVGIKGVGQVQVPLDLALLTCTPQPHQLVTRTIGRDGGRIVVGKHWLSIPAGALNHPVTITAEAISDSINSVHFEPHGLTFAKSPRLYLNYSNCKTNGSNRPRQIVYVNDVLDILEQLQSYDSSEDGDVWANISHFSRYAVAW